MNIYPEFEPSSDPIDNLFNEYLGKIKSKLNESGHSSEEMARKEQDLLFKMKKVFSNFLNAEELERSQKVRNSEKYLVETTKPGESLDQTSVYRIAKESNTGRACAIEIRNYRTDIVLSHPEVFLGWGYISKQPANNILPGYKEACCFRKHKGTATGTYGVLTYKIKRIDEKGVTSDFHNPSTLMMAWGVPWHWNFHNFYHAIGIDTKQQTVNFDLYESLLFKNNTSDSTREVSGKSIYFDKQIEDIVLKIISSMSQENKSVVIVEIR